MKSIIIRLDRPLEPKLVGHVRLTPEAETRLRELARESDESIRHIASEIILQAADYVEFL